MATTSPTFTTDLGTSKRLADYEPLAKICASFILELFGISSKLSGGLTKSYNSLPYFIAMAFSQAQLPEANALAALTLLQRYKIRYPNRSLSSIREAESVFISSYIAATKVLSDDRYRMNFWVTVGQSKFTIKELTHMEMELFEDLNWDVRIDDATLATYQLLVERKKQLLDVKSDGGEIKWKSRSSTAESHSSTSSSESSNSYGSRASESSESSATSSCPTTPSDTSITRPQSSSSLSSITVQEGELRLKQSEQNIAALDRCIEELQEQLTSMMQESPKGADKPRHKTRHMLKEKILHAFK